MSPRSRRLAVVPSGADAPVDPDPAGAAKADAYDLGLAADRAAAAERFAEGLRTGIALFARLAAGDTALAAQIGRLVDG